MGGGKESAEGAMAPRDLKSWMMACAGLSLMQQKAPLGKHRCYQALTRSRLILECEGVAKILSSRRTHVSERDRGD